MPPRSPRPVPHNQLQHQLEGKAPLLPEAQQAHGNDRQHISHGVIAAALHLQQRRRALLQVQLVLSQEANTLAASVQDSTAPTRKPSCQEK